MIGTECKQFPSFGACAGCRDRDRSFGLHRLYGGETCAAGCRRDENELSLLHLAKLDQCSVSRHVLHPDGRGFDWREMWRILSQSMNRNDDLIAEHTVLIHGECRHGRYALVQP